MDRKRPRIPLEQNGQKPKHEKLPWPGLRAKDHLTLVVTRMEKEAREAKETESWARQQIARVLDYTSPEIVMRLVVLETHRRRKPIPPVEAYSL